MFLKKLCIFHFLTFTLLLRGSIPKKIQNKFNSIKNKVINFSPAENNVNLFSDINESEYPGNNPIFKKIHRKSWEEYYNCLKKQYIEVGVKKSFYPIAAVTMEGIAAVLNCTLCISPSEIYTAGSLEWLFKSVSSINSKKKIMVEATEYTVISVNDHTLTLFDVHKNQEGVYWCKMGSTLSAPYYLYVINDTEPITMVRTDEASKAQHSMPSVQIENIGLEVYSSWTPWTSCSTCDTIGKRLRYGYCMISSYHSSKQESDPLEQLSPKPIDIVNNAVITFRNKLPCRSWYTPQIIQDIAEVKNRTTEVMIGFCKEECQNNVIFEIRDKQGNIIESANNSAGIYSTLQGVPNNIHPSVVRITQYGKHDTYTQIKCPGNLNIDSPIIWKIETKILNEPMIDQQSQGRISVDPFQRIIIENLRYSDENIYSCWQRGELVGVVRLKVTYELAKEILKLNHRTMMIAGIPVIIIMLWIFWRAFQRSHFYSDNTKNRK